MADERILAPIRRFWNEAQLDAAYEAIFTAYHGRIAEVTVIVGKASDGDSATGQIIIAAADYEKWLDACEARKLEYEATAAGVTSGPTAATHADFGSRYLST